MQAREVTLNAGLKSTIVFVAISALVGFFMGMIGVPVMTRLTVSVGMASIGTVIFTNLSGNRKSVRVDAGARARLLAEPPPADRAVLLVYREGFVGMAVGIDVAIDGRTVAQLKSPACTRVALTPGRHRVSAQMVAAGAAPGDLDLTARAGETVAVKLKMKMGGIRGRLALEPESDVDGARRRLAGVAMVEPDLAEV